MKTKAFKLIPSFLMVLSAPGLASARDSQVFKGTMSCEGPYNDWDLPTNYIQIKIEWDDLFGNSDVRTKIGSTDEIATAFFYLANPKPYWTRQKSYFEGGVKLKKRSFTLLVYHGQESDPESQVNEGMLTMDGHHWYQLQCRETLKKENGGT